MDKRTWLKPSETRNSARQTDEKLIFFGQYEICADNRIRVQLAGCEKMLEILMKQM